MRLQPKCLSGDTVIKVFYSLDDTVPVEFTLKNYTRKYMLSNDRLPAYIEQVDEVTGLIGVARIMTAIASGRKKLFDVVAGGHQIAASKDHRFYISNDVQASWKRLVHINHLFDKVAVKTLDGESIRFVDINSVVIREREEECFDIEVAGRFPNFFANGIVVHNSR